MALARIPSQFTKLFTSFSDACNEEEQREIVVDLKERHPEPTALKDGDIIGAFHELYLRGTITKDDLGILYTTAEKSQNKDQIISLLDEFKLSQPLKTEAFIGRSKEKQELLELLSDQTIHGVNIHGVKGVGKTSMAKEVVKEMEQNSWETITFDMRGAKDIHTAYLFILYTLGHQGFFGDIWIRNWIAMGQRQTKREKILTFLLQKCKRTKQLLLLFDNVESELTERYNDDSLFNAITASQECKTGLLKVVLTSTLPIQIDSFRNYHLEPLPSPTCADLIFRRSKHDSEREGLEEADEGALAKVAELCRKISYLLANAEQILRNGFITSQELLQKIEAQIGKSVPVEYVTTETLFDCIPTDSLKKLAVKLCVFPNHFLLQK